MDLIPKVFTWNELNYGDGTMQFGLIAQDVIAAFEKHGLNYIDYGFVSSYEMEDGLDYYGISYDSYHMMTAAVLRKMIVKFDAQQKQLDSLQEQINEMRRIQNGN